MVGTEARSMISSTVEEGATLLYPNQREGRPSSTAALPARSYLLHDDALAPCGYCDPLANLGQPFHATTSSCMSSSSMLALSTLGAVPATLDFAGYPSVYEYALPRYP